MCPDETLKQWNVLLTIENYRYFCHKIYCSWQHTSRKENRGRRRQKKLFQTSVNFFRYLVILTWTRARKKGSFHFLWLVMIEKKGNMCSLGYHNIPGTIYQSSFTQKRHRGRRLTTRTSSPRLFWRGFLIYGTVHSCSFFVNVTVSKSIKNFEMKNGSSYKSNSYSKSYKSDLNKTKIFGNHSKK